MCDFGIDAGSFNPRVFYILKRDFKYGDNVNIHSHDFISMFYIMSGSCSYNIGGSLYPVKKGDLIICNSGVSHGKTMNPGEEVSEFQVGLSNISIEGLPQNCLIAGDDLPVTNLKKYEQEFLKCCSDILTEQEKREPGWEILLKTLIMKLVVIFLKDSRVCPGHEEHNSLDFESFDKTAVANTLMTFITENYMQNISLETMSRSMYMSPVYISKVFKEETGESPINYLIKVRLSKARELLEGGKHSVKAVARLVGYEDAYHFSKLYKKYYGHPPSQSRHL
jgi:AraC-like DNA-binding protein